MARTATFDRLRLPVLMASGGAAEFVENALGFFELGEEFFGVAEDFWMDAAAGAIGFDGVTDVEHFVEHDVLDGEAGGVGFVEEAGDDDGVVGGVEVAEVGL